MGRRTKNVENPVRNHALLGWGIFISLLLGVASPQLGLSTVAAIALVGTCLVVFLLLWLLSSSRGSSRS
ncbi:MAG: hypothetical protein ABWX63_11880 [Paeniglutamicibacter terrestris]|uniref:Uncharacterized protein n=1 Tax=Paeniglutamicibacter terrestris TaxID=2723403 RepID=A0ABX1G6R3_9MICC|nr:hypothetical protein [Paeniglutamicibacter terrestris]ASN39513.1 hypothetical protein CGQ24_11105 [Arthrobacter sp. 7749]NKG21963.1 hypothetical protein [Paeniglutamicibacter terrestris]